MFQVGVGTLVMLWSLSGLVYYCPTPESLEGANCVPSRVVPKEHQQQFNGKRPVKDEVIVTDHEQGPSGLTGALVDTNADRRWLRTRGLPSFQLLGNM